MVVLGLPYISTEDKYNVDSTLLFFANSKTLLVPLLIISKVANGLLINSNLEVGVAVWIT